MQISYRLCQCCDLLFTTLAVYLLIILWWAGKQDKGALGDSGVGTASEADSHDDSIAVEGDKLVIRQQPLPVAAAAAELSANETVRYCHVARLVNIFTLNKLT